MSHPSSGQSIASECFKTAIEDEQSRVAGLNSSASATVGQFCLTKAFTLGVPSRVAVVGLSQVGFALIFELILENRDYNKASLLGMMLVLAPTASLLLRRHDSEPALPIQDS